MTLDRGFSEAQYLNEIEQLEKKLAAAEKRIEELKTRQELMENDLIGAKCGDVRMQGEKGACKINRGDRFHNYCQVATCPSWRHLNKKDT